MKKRIGDLTIREVAKVCQKYKVCIDGCPFYNEDSNGYGSCKPAFMVKEDLRLNDEVEVNE